MKRILARKAKQTEPHGLDVLVRAPNLSKEGDERIKMTISCRDCDYIPKVKDAGLLKEIKDKKYQVMHNGLLVELGGYYGSWMSEIIKSLKGHHEPQEEKVFHELLKLVPQGATMVELGSYWSYYSIWFNKTIGDATNYCCEPDPANIDLGKRNAAVNNTNNMQFIAAAAGSDDGKIISFAPQDGHGENLSIPIRSIDGLVREYDIEFIDVLHIDVQGAEFDALKGAEESIKRGKVRFAIISTHHYCISGNPLLHEMCLELVKQLGGHIITEHAIHESFSGDGLIAVSFFSKDRNLEVNVSENRMQNSLFRPYNHDLAVLLETYETLRVK